MDARIAGTAWEFQRRKSLWLGERRCLGFQATIPGSLRTGHAIPFGLPQSEQQAQRLWQTLIIARPPPTSVAPSESAGYGASPGSRRTAPVPREDGHAHSPHRC